jgi:glycogen debranching enzyme
MHRHVVSFGMAAAMLAAVPAAVHSDLHAQAVSPLPPAPSFISIPAIPFDSSGLVIRAHTETFKPFTVAGERGVLLGQQGGEFEAWVLPVKLLSHLTIEAEMQGWDVPINVNQYSAEIEVRPDRTVITYSHPGFTVRQIMFSPDDGPEGTGPVALFEFDCLRPTDFTFRFTPNLEWMWPERNEGNPNPDWDEHGGFYILHSDFPDLAGAIAMPGAQPGILAPYQERPQVHAVELKLHIDPARDRGRLFPLLMAVGMTPATATNQALAATLAQLNAGVAASYQAHAERYKKLLANSVSIETPDKALNEAFQWAVVSIEQLRAKAYRPNPSAPSETALVAGYYSSGDSARPGFGWFFGRDALYTLYAVNGYGDFALAKEELEFLIRRQRADGKIMHEYSQTAPAVDWAAFPYEYAAADSTPLFLLAVADYVRASGDVAFLTAHRDAIEKAWGFETDPAHDTDHDGIYDNSQGTGWVESWPGGMPHQEIYLALLDQQASSAMAEIESLLGDSAKSASANQRAASIAKTIESEYYDAEKGCYAFSYNGSAGVDHTTTVYPAMAWWDPADGKATLAHPESCLKQFAAAALDTDWGLRDVADTEKIYDGLSYHQGSVWPLFTGWAALAEYRGGQPLAGYQLLMQNANLTEAQDLGSVTELLSGDFFVPFGRSTSHQLWSSAMVITPILRGMFGISIDAEKKTITVNPHLPAGWDKVKVRNLPVGNDFVDLQFLRFGRGLILEETPHGDASIPIATTIPGTKQVGAQRIEFDESAIRVELPIDGPIPGTRSDSVRVLREEYGERRLVLTLEGQAGTDVRIPFYESDARVKPTAVGAELPTLSGPNAPSAQALPLTMSVHFPPGEGWKTITVTLTW